MGSDKTQRFAGLQERLTLLFWIAFRYGSKLKAGQADELPTFG